MLQTKIYAEYHIIVLEKLTHKSHKQSKLSKALKTSHFIMGDLLVRIFKVRKWYEMEIETL